MIQRAKHFYEFGRFRIDEGERVLLREGQPVPLAPKVFDTLALVKDCGHVLQKEELMTSCGRGTFVEERNLTNRHFTVTKGSWRRPWRALHRNHPPARKPLWRKFPKAGFSRVRRITSLPLRLSPMGSLTYPAATKYFAASASPTAYSCSNSPRAPTPPRRRRWWARPLTSEPSATKCWRRI